MIHSWTEGVFEVSPPDSDPADELGLRIRNLKVAIRERIEVEHDWSDHDDGAGAQTDTGRHNFPVVADDAALVAVTPVVDGMIAGQTDIATLFQRQAGSYISLHGTAYLTAAERAALTTTRLSAGFLVYESDTLMIWGWDGAAWVRLVPSPGWIDSDKATDDNQSAAVLSTWEDVDGSYNGGTQLGIEFATPNDGRNYEIFVQATCCLGSSSRNHTGGFRLMEDGVEKDVRILKWDEGYGSLDTTLIRSTPNPTGGVTYKYTVEWAAADADVRANPTGAFLGKGAGIWTMTNWCRIWGYIKVKKT